MTKIDGKVISKLEKLSRLKLNNEEREQIVSDLDSIVEMFDTLQEVDTEGIEPLRHMSEVVNVLRNDKVANELSNEEGLYNAPKTHEGFIAVPKFLKPTK
ncbi:MAG: aspartyl-tRNA(Asn)/glutamyl-tRNA(Gln) amidotransferase subunit C [Saprospiraceae bacterium]|jgi:aspartyl-tRNA(Asn)/glutamyl-tRNA(Gln) amidotransferase subunit C